MGAEIFNMEEFEGAEWVLISDDAPMDENQRDEMLERFQVHYHPAARIDHRQRRRARRRARGRRPRGGSGGLGRGVTGRLRRLLASTQPRWLRARKQRAFACLGHVTGRLRRPPAAQLRACKQQASAASGRQYRFAVAAVARCLAYACEEEREGQHQVHREQL